MRNQKWKLNQKLNNQNIFNLNRNPVIKNKKFLKNN